jgi:Ser/Thr protein kinase RdoA (MazF antagonist)
MGQMLVTPDWLPLSDEEVRAVLGGYEQTNGGLKSSDAVVVWQSPRPMSAASLVRVGGPSVFVKRHHRAVRTPHQLRVEHAFASHLRTRGQPVPRVFTRHDGTTVVEAGDFVYEVHEPIVGADLYRHAVSWSPFRSLDHARAAGRALAAFHAAARGFPLPSRAASVLISSTAIVGAADPLAALQRLIDSRPGLAHAVGDHPLVEDFARHHLGPVKRAAPLLAALEPQWGHGDWHPSNLAWSSMGAGAVVSGVFDLGLSNRTFAVHDLAIALERSTIDWLDLARRGQVEADLDSVDALLAGYEELHPLSEPEAAALGELLPVVHIEYALSEVEYFAAVVRSEANADLAYENYLVGHSRWFEGALGSALLDHLRRRGHHGADGVGVPRRACGLMARSDVVQVAGSSVWST